MKKYNQFLLSAPVLLALAAACSNPAGIGRRVQPDPLDTMEFVTVPGVAEGFQYGRGSSDKAVIVSSYKMLTTPVTQELYEAVMGVNPSGFNGSPGKEAALGENQARRPVEWVSWYDAVEFCNRLSRIKGKTPVYGRDAAGEVTADWNADGFRLPTEMEWMWAAMGADKGGVNVRTEGWQKAYAGSEESSGGRVNINDYAWHIGIAVAKTHEVGLKKPNELGLFDMSGNVWEWCWDRWVHPVSGPLPSDYRGPDSGSSRVVRGGGPGATCSVNLRACNINPSNDIGFRVVCR